MSRPLNGFKLLGHLDRRDGTLVVLVDRGNEHDPYVTARVRTLDDVEWDAGMYFTSYKAAARNMLNRADVPVLPY